MPLAFGVAGSRPRCPRCPEWRLLGAERDEAWAELRTPFPGLSLASSRLEDLDPPLRVLSGEVAGIGGSGLRRLQPQRASPPSLGSQNGRKKWTPIPPASGAPES